MSSDASANGLSPAAAERLALLAEECGEVIQAVGKILRHGYDSHHPHHYKPGTNRQQLEHELGDLIGTIGFLAQAGDIDENAMVDHAEGMADRKRPWLHHQADLYDMLDAEPAAPPVCGACNGERYIDGNQCRVCGGAGVEPP